MNTPSTRHEVTMQAQWRHHGVVMEMLWTHPPWYTMVHRWTHDSPWRHHGPAMEDWRHHIIAMESQGRHRGDTILAPWRVTMESPRRCHHRVNMGSPWRHHWESIEPPLSHHGGMVGP